MTQTSQDTGRTFKLLAVEPLEDYWEPEVGIVESITSLTKGKLEACSEPGIRLVPCSYHPLISVVRRCWAEHRPLTLSPDAIWLTIAQGVAQHVKNNAEKLRHKLVEHDGKKDIIVSMDGFVRGSQDNPWPSLFAVILKHLAEHSVSDLHKVIRKTFSTTGPVEQAALDVVFMDAVRHYHDLSGCYVCGIPSITLEGAKEDWYKLANGVAAIAALGLDLDWWFYRLNTIIYEFLSAYAGRPNLPFWADIVALGGICEPDNESGWIADLIPYTVSRDGCVKINPRFDGGYKNNVRVYGDQFPSGISSCPFTWKECDGKDYKYEFLAGFIGATLNRETHGLSPKIGWAIRPQEEG